MMTPTWVFPAYPLLLTAPFAAALISAADSSATSLRDGATGAALAAITTQGTGFLIAFLISAAFIYRLMTQKLPRDFQRPGIVSRSAPESLSSSLLFSGPVLRISGSSSLSVPTPLPSPECVSSPLRPVSQEDRETRKRLKHTTSPTLQTRRRNSLSRASRLRNSHSDRPSPRPSPLALALWPHALVLHRLCRLPLQVHPSRPLGHPLPHDLVELRLPQHRARDGDPGHGQRAGERGRTHFWVRDGRAADSGLGMGVLCNGSVL